MSADRIKEIEAMLSVGYSADTVWDEAKNNSYACLQADKDVQFLLDEVKRLAAFKAAFENMPQHGEITRIDDYFILSLGPGGDYIYKTIDEVAQKLIEEGDKWNGS